MIAIDPATQILTNLAVLLLIGLLISIASKKLKLPNILLLMIAGLIIGVFFKRDSLQFDNVFLVSIAILTGITEAAAIALVNQIRRQERDEARDAIIMALAKLAERRDPETGAHLERVQGYCRLLSEALAEMPAYISHSD